MIVCMRVRAVRRAAREALIKPPEPGPAGDVREILANDLKHAPKGALVLFNAAGAGSCGLSRALAAPQPTPGPRCFSDGGREHAREMALI